MRRHRQADRALARLAGELSSHALGLILAAALSVALVVGTLWLPVLAGQAIDCTVGPGDVNFAELMHTLRVLLLVLVGTALCQWALSALVGRIVHAVVRNLRDAAFARIQHMPLSRLDHMGGGDVANRVVTDAEQLTAGLLAALLQLPCGVLTVAVTLAFMFALNTETALVVALLTPISILIARWIATRSSRHFSAQARLRGELSSSIEEAIAGHATIMAFNQAETICASAAHTNAQLGEESLKAVFFSSMVMPTTRFANALVYVAIGAFGALVALSGGITVGGLAAFLGYADQYAKPFNDVSGVVTEMQAAMAGARRLLALIDEPEEKPDGQQALSLTHARGHVELVDVSFGYEPHHSVLHHLDLDVAPGTLVALVGHTGCGKTTLINLLMRFYDVTGGRIMLDGHDLREYRRGDLREAWGMVLQDTWVRQATVRENVTMGRPNATDEEIYAALADAYADGFVRRLPHGLNTVLGSDVALSAGQRQLLCIARVLLARPSLLILDEATSNIDTRTELLVQRALERLMQGRTCFVVAHRLSTVRNADLICVMDAGHIVERGTHDELLARNGHYRAIYDAQFAQTA